MRKVTLFLSCLFICTLSISAQRSLKNPLIDSRVILEKGVALHNDGKYKAAIAEFLKVPESDTSYSDVLHEIIYSYYRDSNYVEAEKYSHIGLSRFPHNKTKWYNFLANIYDDTKRSDLALAAYDTILLQNKYDYLSLFNRGIALYRLERFDEAATSFQRCLVVNPYYTSAHYFLANVALMKGNLVQALLSFSTYLIIEPSGKYHKQTVGYLTTICEVNTVTTEYLKKHKGGREDDFEEIQEILVNKISLDKKYKLKADLEDQIVRQLQVVSEKLDYNANDKGFWMQYYVPLFKGIWDQGDFEPMIFNMFSGLEIKKVKEYKNKEKKKIEGLTSMAVKYLNNIRESQELIFTKRESAQPRYYVKDYLITGKGNYAKNKKGEIVVDGPWEFYHTNGRIKSKGTFGKEGLRQGEWQFFYENGILKESSFYTDDLANGKSQAWSDNGLLNSTGNYTAGKEEGKHIVYFYSGKLFSVINYKAGNKEGLAEYYNIKGYLRTRTQYVNDLEEGVETVFTANGKIESTTNYIKGIANGAYVEYYNNGNIKVKGNLVEGEKNGTWIYSHKDGKLETEQTFVKGELDGESKSFYANGKPESIQLYRKGEVDGIQKSFDDDGLLYCESVYEKGRLRDIKFLDKKGNVISNTTSRKGNADITFFSPEGTKQSQGYYSKDGLAEGLFNYYYKNGNISATGSYKNGLKEGDKTFYHPNKQKSQEGTYKDDKANGYFINYYNNGQISSEGWYKDDQQQGTFIYYDLLGKVTYKTYYLNDQVHGISENYFPTGKMNSREHYDYSWFNGLESFDSTGKLITHTTLNKGQGKIHIAGNTLNENNYNFYKLNGLYKRTYGDGSKRVEAFYKNGDQDSLYRVWYPNGKLQVEGKFLNGKKTGSWKFYYYNGKLQEEEQYVEGDLQGKDVQYNEDGSLSKEFFFKDDEVDGEVKYYGDNGELIMSLIYKEGILTGYSYQDKTGKLVPIIPLKNEAGQLDAYYKNGTKSASMRYNEGKVDGEKKLFFTNGKPMLVLTNINGMENGIVKKYYASGKIQKEENYYYGEQHGSCKYYNEDGTLSAELNYYLGDLHGTCIYYKAGKPSENYYYYYGILQSKK